MGELSIYNSCSPIYGSGEIFLESINYNIGNYFITDSLVKNLKYDRINFINSGDGWNKKKNFIESVAQKLFKEEQSIVIFQDHISKNLINKFEKILLNLPDDVIIISLGFNNFHHEHMIPCFNINIREKLIKISSKSVIGVRGKFTKNFLSINGIKNTEITGCPSYFRRTSLKLPQISKAEFLDNNAIIGGDFNHPKFNNPGAYLVQGDYDESLVGILKRFNRPVEDYMSLNLSQLNTDFTFNHARPESIIFPLKFGDSLGALLSRYKFYIGSRIHGCIVSNFYGIPAVCTNWDMRAIEMCSHLNIPHIMNFPSLANSDEFIETFNNAINYQNASYSELHCAYLNFLEKNKLKYV